MATPEAGAQTPRPLWREHERSMSGPISCWRDPDMAPMVRPTVSEECHPMGPVPGTPEALSATPGHVGGLALKIVHSALKS